MRQLIVFLTAAAWTASAAPDTLGPEQARGEIQQVATAVRDHHPDPWLLTPREDFERAVSVALRITEPVSIGRHWFVLSSLLALVHDTHT